MHQTQVELAPNFVIKRYSCSLCPYYSVQKSNLLRHFKTHTNERPYCCTQCDKSFTLKQALDIHTRTHSGEQPFVCNICGKAFSQLGNFKRHCAFLHQQV
ncbi:hypothetical protein CEXT_118711 [Caerostris extrusa]|uniref:C2H2-type domain-containing protein n=1 Tax=Caerostris extrusa TaxID=172846 RepID=A0AAV4VTK8_CAEEX|nr:hypothetical protein CEXT_118711 [Caerostris extrusa]